MSYYQSYRSIPFGFIDETGLSFPDKHQPFLGVGLFKVYRTSSITDRLLKECYLHYSKIQKRSQERLNEMLRERSVINNQIIKTVSGSQSREYKFEHITKYTLDSYIELLDALSLFEWSFDCVMIDKYSQAFDPLIYQNYWKGYLMYTKMLVKSSTKYDKGITLIADFLNKPKSYSSDFESDIIKIPKVINAMQADSASMIYLQIVDLMLGSVSFHSKRMRGVIHDSKRAKAKEIFVDRLLHTIGLHKSTSNPYPLAYSVRSSKRNRFNVWHVRFEK